MLRFPIPLKRLSVSISAARKESLKLVFSVFLVSGFGALGLASPGFAFPGFSPTDSGTETAAEGLHAGPLFDSFDLTLQLGGRTEAAGPFYYHETTSEDETWGLPPFFSHWGSPATESEEINFAYPIISYIRYGQQYRFQVFQLLSFAGGPSQTEPVRKRFTLFPLYFQQRSSDPSQNYTAVGPFYGHLQNHLFRDEIFFVMFPGFSRTRKADVVTDNYLFPFFHLRHGNGLHGWQLWPLAGHEHKVLTVKTNGFGDEEKIGGHDHWFALWPIFFNQHNGTGTENPEWDNGVLPLYSLQRSPQRDSTTVIWPFFSRVNDREHHYREWDVPWPLVVFAHGAGKTTHRVWPFFSHAASTNQESSFYMWPIYRHSGMHKDGLERERTQVMFFLHSDVRARNLKAGTEKRRVDLWPFFTHHRDLNGNTRLQVLALLEPFLPENPNIEREYAPVYSLWRAEKNAQTGATSRSLLWNLYRRETSPEGKRVSAFFGLYQSRSGAAGAQRKFLFFRW